MPNQNGCEYVVFHTGVIIGANAIEFAKTEHEAVKDAKEKCKELNKKVYVAKLIRVFDLEVVDA